VFTVPAVAGRLVGLSVGVIVAEDSVSAKTPGIALEAAAAEACEVWLVFTALEVGVETELTAALETLVDVVAEVVEFAD
jgi:hypothetical protein